MRTLRKEDGGLIQRKACYCFRKVWGKSADNRAGGRDTLKTTELQFTCCRKEIHKAEVQERDVFIFPVFSYATVIKTE